MIKSVLPKQVYLSFFLLAMLMLFSFSIPNDAQQLITWSNKTLAQVYDPSGEVKLKKWELTVSDDLFLRLRKTYQNGRQEYYSCQLHNFNELDYLGTTTNGLLKISTRADDIIVQTYNDHQGDVDSMATTLTIPVKNMEAEQVDSLRNALMFFKSSPAVINR
jgi:hypothetical protein